MINNDDVVLVTGASGFIASWIVAYLLRIGCKVRGTVRDPKNENKVKHLKALPGASERLELVALDLNNEAQFDEVVQGVTLIAHTASPFPATNPKHEDELIKPAVNGTLGVLRAALKVPTVRAIIITSSVAAVGEGESIKGLPQKVRGESDWTEPQRAIPYSKSKTLAEKAAWDFWREHDKPWAMCTVNPSFVLGPSLSDEVTTSTGMVTRFLNSELPAVPHLAFGLVDVRDVARAHVAALNADPSAITGRRFILHNQTLWLKEVAAISKATFGPMGYWISTIPAPYPVLYLASFVDKQIAMLLNAIGIYAEYDNGPSKEVLKIEYTDLKKVLSDAGHSVVYHKLVKRTKKYAPPSPDWTPLTS